ncbi:hypothetical protein PENSPDRAFT_693042 [Peniophora sp. CONT]|nr:hypothetical protein PENSPDRAFT_693042 [Peniophora sp. CONT]
MSDFEDYLSVSVLDLIQEICILSHVTPRGLHELQISVTPGQCEHCPQYLEATLVGAVLVMHMMSLNLLPTRVPARSDSIGAQILFYIAYPVLCAIASLDRGFKRLNAQTNTCPGILQYWRSRSMLLSARMKYTIELLVFFITMRRRGVHISCVTMFHCFQKSYPFELNSVRELKLLLWGKSSTDNLPDDVLFLIFEHFKDSARPLLLDSWLFPSDRVRALDRYLSLSLVCQHWRVILLCSPSFWSPLVLGYGWEWTICALDRSKCCPLDIVIHHCNWGGASPMDTNRAIQLVIHGQWDRIRSMRLTYSPDTVQAFAEAARILSTFPVPPSSLENLYVAWDAYAKIDEPDSQLLFPNDIFGGAPATRLQDLYLSGCNVHIRCPLLMGPLVRLRLLTCSVWSCLDELLELFLLLPALEDFYCEGCAGCSDPQLRRVSLVHLPRMQTFYLKSSSSFSAALISRLVLPAASRLDLFFLDLLNGHDSATMLAEVTENISVSCTRHLAPSRETNIAQDSAGFTLQLRQEESFDEDVPSLTSIAFINRDTRDSVYSVLFAEQLVDEHAALCSLAILTAMVHWPVVRTAVTSLDVEHPAIESASWNGLLKPLTKLVSINIGSSGVSASRAPTMHAGLNLANTLFEHINLLPLLEEVALAAAWLTPLPSIPLSLCQALCLRAQCGGLSPIRLIIWDAELPGAHGSLDILRGCAGISVVSTTHSSVMAEVWHT